MAKGWHGDSAGHARAALKKSGGRRKKVHGKELARMKARNKIIRKAHRADTAKRKRNLTNAIRKARG